MATNGSNGDDILHGIGAGAHTIYGNDGKDRLDGHSGDDYLDGGDGNDRVIGSSGNDILLGGAGDDHLTGDDGADDLDGVRGMTGCVGASVTTRLTAAPAMISRHMTGIIRTTALRIIADQGLGQ